MRESLKQKLDESVPAEITLSDIKKRQILKAAQNHDVKRKPAKSPKWMPALAGVAVIGLAGVLGYPYVSDWQEQRGAVEEKNLEDSLQRVVLPVNENPELINAVYHANDGVLVYQEGQKIYSYDIDAKEGTVLTEVPEGQLIRDVVAEGEWLVWTELSEADGEDSSGVNVYNLSDDELVSISDLNVLSPVIDGDQMSFLSFGSGSSYKLLDLVTLEETVLYQSTEGANSIQAFNEGLVVVPERREAVGITELLVYEAENGTFVEQYKLPSETAMNIQLDDNKVYAQLIDNDFTATLTTIDLKTGIRSEIDTPEFSAYAVYGDYLALSVPEGGADTVRLFKMEGDSLTALPVLDKIEERLVKPRFTKDGTLVLNGEGEERAMYLLDVTE